MSEERDETARRYREAAEARLSGLTVEAAGVFQREEPDADQNWLLALVRIYERLTKGRVGRLPAKRDYRFSSKAAAYSRHG
jgi:hypothetical protein